MKALIRKFWKAFKSTIFGKVIRKLAPQWAVNTFEHLPVGLMANLVYGFPSRKIKVIGVTGTDGKTTTVNMIYQVLRDAGLKVSMVSTINAVIGNQSYDTGFHVTSPHSFNVQEYIKKAVQDGSEYIVLEVTSHALDQHRFIGVSFYVGVITNVTHEHLDYHKTFQNYLKTKAKLIKSVRFAVLNADDPNFDYLTKQTSGQVISVSLRKSTDLNLKKLPLKLKIPGEYNLSNAEQAAAVGQVLGVKKEQIIKSLQNFTALSGRMEEIKNQRGVKIVVDFAHTPNALENALKTLRTESRGRLIAVFGAAAQRDLEKRPMMGKISAQLADITILTDEDPRFEDRNKIISEIAAGVLEAGAIENQTLFRVPDRTKAIGLAIKIAKRGDTVGIFGKGHEKSMNYKGIEKKWSDKEAVLKVLNSQKNGS